MNTYILIATGVIVFLFAVVIAIRGLRGASDEKNIIPIAEHEQIKQLRKDVFSEYDTASIIRASYSNSSEQVVKENVIQKEEKNEALPQKNIEIKNAEERINDIPVEQTAEYIEEPASQLTQESLRLIDEIEALKENNAQLARQNGQWSEENDSLKRKIEMLQLQTENIVLLENEKRDLVVKLKDTQLKFEDLQNQINKLKKDYEKETIDDQQEMKTLKERLASQREVQPDLALQAEHINLAANLEELKKELVRVKDDFQGGQKKVAELENANFQLKEQEDDLRFELTKARAQALGLEKICADYKTQLEQEMIL